MKEKKDNNILVYLAMVVLFALIALPPTFRSLMPRVEVESGASKVDNVDKSITSLSCRKTAGKYEILANSIFKSNGISKVNITYTDTSVSTSDNATIINPADQTTPPVQDANAVAENSAVVKEMEDLKAINGIEFNEVDNIHRFTIDATTIDSASAGADISKRLQDLTNTKNYYSSIGYTCTQASS